LRWDEAVMEPPTAIDNDATKECGCGTESRDSMCAMFRAFQHRRRALRDDPTPCDLVRCAHDEAFATGEQAELRAAQAALVYSEPWVAPDDLMRDAEQFSNTTNDEGSVVVVVDDDASGKGILTRKPRRRRISEVEQLVLDVADGRRDARYWFGDKAGFVRYHDGMSDEAEGGSDGSDGDVCGEVTQGRRRRPPRPEPSELDFHAAMYGPGHSRQSAASRRSNGSRSPQMTDPFLPPSDQLPHEPYASLLPAARLANAPSPGSLLAVALTKVSSTVLAAAMLGFQGAL
jgi:hypothetical protein